MKNKTIFINTIIAAICLAVSLISAYLIFNIFVFIIVPFLMLLILPILYALLNARSIQEFNIHKYEYAVCILFSVIIIGYNQFIIQSTRFIELTSKLETNSNMSIQDVNLVTYIIAILLFSSIYYYSKKMAFNRITTKEKGRLYMIDTKFIKVGEVHFVFNKNKTAWIAITSDAIPFCKKYVTAKDEIALIDLSNDELNIYEALQKLDELNLEHDEMNEVKSCYVHVTQDCNLKCPYCYSKNDMRNMHQNLNLEEWESSLDLIKQSGFERLVFSGGEPLLYKDIGDLLKFCKELNFKEIDLISNGILINNDRIEFLKKYVDNLCISLDGYNEETNSPTRGKGTFKIVVENIKLLRLHNVSINIISTIYKENIEDIEKYIELANQLDCTISFSLFTMSGEAFENPELEQSKDQLVGLTDYLLDDELPELIFDNIPVIKGIQYREGCGAGTYLISINADGSVYPCHFMMEENLKVGNILVDPIEKILSVAKEHSTHMKIDNIAECSECDFKNFCGGGCRANTYKGKGNIRKSSDCEFYKSYYNKIIGELT